MVTINYITLGISILSICIAAFAAISTYKVNRRKDYKMVITAERTKWLNSLREDVADFLNLAKEIYYLKRKVIVDKAKYLEYEEIIINKTREFNKKSLMINLRINPKEIEIINKIFEIINFSKEFENNKPEKPIDQKARLDALEKKIECCLNELVDVMRLFFKKEWEEIKKDAREL